MADTGMKEQPTPSLNGPGQPGGFRLSMVGERSLEGGFFRYQINRGE